MRRELFLIALAGAMSAAHAADAYKWIDGDGTVHYSDTEPPAEAKAQKVHLSGTLALQEASSGAAATDADNAAPAASASAIAAADPQARCDRARKDLELLQGGGTVGRDDGTGKAVAFSEEARQSEIARAQNLIAHSCK
jgi:hypothetical protein